MATMSSNKVRTPLGRFSFPSLVTPSAPPGSDQDPNYNVTLIMSSEEDVTEIRKAINEIAVEKFGEAKLKALIKSGKFRNPLKSNETRVDDEGNPRQGFEDASGWHLTAKSYDPDKFMVVDSKRNPIGKENVKGGYYGKLVIGLSAYDRAGNSGVSCYLQGVQVCKRGETFGGSSVASVDDFGVEEGDDFGADDLF